MDKEEAKVKGISTSFAKEKSQKYGIVPASSKAADQYPDAFSGQQVHVQGCIQRRIGGEKKGIGSGKMLLTRIMSRKGMLMKSRPNS